MVWFGGKDATGLAEAVPWQRLREGGRAANDADGRASFQVD